MAATSHSSQQVLSSFFLRKKGRVKLDPEHSAKSGWQLCVYLYVSSLMDG